MANDHCMCDNTSKTWYSNKVKSFVNAPKDAQAIAKLEGFSVVMITMLLCSYQRSMFCWEGLAHAHTVPGYQALFPLPPPERACSWGQGRLISGGHAGTTVSLPLATLQLKRLGVLHAV